MQAITDTLFRTNQTFYASSESMRRATKRINFKQVYELHTVGAVQSLTQKRSKVLEEKFQSMFAAVQRKIEELQAEERRLTLEGEKMKVRVKAEAMKKIALQKPEREDREQQIGRRKTHLTNVKAELKAKIEAFPRKLSKDDVERAAAYTNQMRSDLKELRESINEKQRETRNLEDVIPDAVSVPAPASAAAPASAPEPEEAASSETDRRSRERKETLAAELRDLRGAVEKLESQKRDFLAFKAKTMQEFEEKTRAMREMKQRMTAAAAAQAPKSAASVQATRDPKALMGLARVLFPARVSSLVVQIIEMVVESTVCSKDGFRIVAKDAVRSSLDMGNDLIQEAFDAMCKNNIVAQDDDYIWEARV